MDGECPICLSACERPSMSPCGHVFCKACIQRVDGMSNLRLGNCPICRAFISLSSVTEADEIRSIHGSLSNSTWVQGWPPTPGMASYTFDDDRHFISYESPSCLAWPPLDDGTRPPPRKYFLNSKLDEASLTFEGSIDWSPTAWQGDQRWEYRMEFSPDLATIMRGTGACAQGYSCHRCSISRSLSLSTPPCVAAVRAYAADGSVTHVDEFGANLRYTNLLCVDCFATVAAPVAHQRESFRRPGEGVLGALWRHLRDLAD